VPLTGAPGPGALYPSIQAGESGLTKVSYALADQVRSIDKRRVRRVVGHVTRDELRRIDEGLVLFLSLEPAEDSGHPSSS